MPLTETSPQIREKRAVPARLAFILAGAALSFVGAGIAGSLGWSERVGVDLPCTANGGCALVAASRWSHINLPFLPHTPVAVLGLLGYVFLLGLSMLRFGTESKAADRRLHGLFWLITGTGTAFSWYLQWVAYAEVHAYCPWCRASAWTMTLLLLTATAERGFTRKKNSL